VQPTSADRIYANNNSIAEHSEGKVRAVKLVYKVDETDEGVSGPDSAIQGRELGSNW
jgi:hypothetical protein